MVWAFILIHLHKKPLQCLMDNESMESSDHNKKKLKKQLENKSSLKLQALLIMMTQQLCSKNLLLFK